LKTFGPSPVSVINVVLAYREDPLVLSQVAERRAPGRRSTVQGFAEVNHLTL
jgi:hypothetical protein